MKKAMRVLRVGSTLSILTFLSCGDTGSERLSLPVSAQGRPARAIAIEGGSLRLTRAEVAVGPLYVCATESAKTELCENALGELLEVHSFDALSTKAQPLGTLSGTSGSVRSGFFDYGISWGLTQQTPVSSKGNVNGHSAELEGELETDAGNTLRFRATLDILPLSAGDAAVNGLKTRHDLSADTSALTVRFDPHAWLRRIKLDKLLALDDDGDGEIVIEPGSQPYEAILQGMTANSPPELIWDRD